MLNDEYAITENIKLILISHQKNEYLNRLLLEKCENYGALYWGMADRK